MLLRLSKDYNCHISVIIHQNKNDNYATGHLGSSIMKKAEIVIDVEKNKENKRVTDVSCGYSRGEDFEKFSILINDSGIPQLTSYIPAEEKPMFLEHLKPLNDLVIKDENPCPY